MASAPLLLAFGDFMISFVTFASLVGLSSLLVIWTWFGLNQSPGFDDIYTRSFATSIFGSVLLSASWLVLAVITFAPSLLLEEHVPYQFGPLFIGLALAIAAGIFGFWVGGGPKKQLLVGSGVLALLWLILFDS